MGFKMHTISCVAIHESLTYRPMPAYGSAMLVSSGWFSIWSYGAWYKRAPWAQYVGSVFVHVVSMWYATTVLPSNVFPAVLSVARMLR